MVTYKYNINEDPVTKLAVRCEMWSPWHLAASLLLAASLSAPKLSLAWKMFSLKSQIRLFNQGMAICLAAYGQFEDDSKQQTLTILLGNLTRFFTESAPRPIQPSSWDIHMFVCPLSI